MKRFIYNLFGTNYQWVRRRCGGYWVQYFNTVCTCLMWSQFEDEASVKRPPCSDRFMHAVENHGEIKLKL